VPSTALKMDRMGPVVLLRLNRPEKHNAFNREMSTALIEALDGLEHDPEARVVVLTGSGEKAFSAGADMTEALGAVEGGGGGDGTALAIRRVALFSKPVIAAVNGLAYGGGALLAVTCDIRIGAHTARFRFPGAAYGLVVGASLLPRIVGAAKAKELILTARTVEAPEAARIGLVNEVVQAPDLEEAALEMARAIAENSPGAVRFSKQVIDAATIVQEAVEREQRANVELWASEDHRRRFREATERLADGGGER
jgi:enoyl-CoA hydratase/carnithine racemase